MARILLFGRLSDVAGWREREVESPFLSALRGQLGAERARLGDALAVPGAQVALDQVIVRGDAPLNAATEAAFLPPMRGAERAMTVRLTFEPFDPGALLTEFCGGRAEVGAVATFTGIARAEAGAALGALRCGRPSAALPREARGRRKR